MKIDLNNLPSGDKITHQIITNLVNEIILLTNQNVSLKDQNISLRAQLALLKKQRFGKSSEKLEAQIAELEIKIEEGELLGIVSRNPRNFPLCLQRWRYLMVCHKILNCNMASKISVFP